MKSAHQLILLALVALLSLLICPMIGERWIWLRETWQPTDQIEASILTQIRLPRVLAAFIAGAALSLSGMTFQSIFRNPLATPFTLGTASGASLGVAIYIRIGLTFSLFGITGTTYASLIGSLITIGIVYSFTRIKNGFSDATLLLAGVAVSLFFSSLILVFQYTSGMAESFHLMRWMMGSINLLDTQALGDLLPFCLAGTLLVTLCSNELNQLMSGDDLARSRGVNVNKIKKRLFLAASLMICGVVAFCGPIGFVGMIAPHVCRKIVGYEHRTLIPASLLLGGTFLVICDTFARTCIAPVEIPVGIITALLGGPFFLLLLLSPQKCD